MASDAVGDSEEVGTLVVTVLIVKGTTGSEVCRDVDVKLEVVVLMTIPD